jgi:uncharacterized protein YcnI
LGLLVSVISLSFSSVASAHVVVRPAEVLTSGFQTFTVGAPNEKGVTFNKVELKIPEGLGHVSPVKMPGWDIEVEKEGSGEEAVATAIIWSGNEVESGFRQDFMFSARVPAEATELNWKAYQTYTNGQTVAWDLTEEEQPTKEDGSPDFSKSGPFSVTKVVAETEATTALNRAEQTAADADSSATRAMYVGIAGVVVGLVGIYLATRKS